MPDETNPPSGDAAEAAAIAADERLVASVGRRLVLWAAGTTLVVLVALGIALYASVASSLAASGVRQLEDRADALRHLIEGPAGRPPGGDDVPAGFAFGGGSSGTFAVVLAPDGRPILPRSMPATSGLPDHDSLGAAADHGRDIRLGAVDGTPVRVLTLPVHSQAGRVYLQIFQDRTAEERTLAVLFIVLLVGGAIVVLVAAAFGVVYARRALVPIRDSLTTQRGALRRQREFAADASHELRTPLTVVRASVEHLRRHPDRAVGEVGDALEDIGAEVEHLTHLVEELLLLARSDSGAVTIERQPVDLGSIAVDAASSLAPSAAERGVTILTETTAGHITGDADRLRQLVLILLDNAVAHASTGGMVTVAVRVDDRVHLTVEDDGPGLRQEEIPRLFERFFRGRGAPAGGSGLGLAIAEWIVTAHGGTISAENRLPTGARFSVELPPAA